MGRTLTYPHKGHNLEITEIAFGWNEGHLLVIASEAIHLIRSAARWIASLCSQ
jgi:hypothetical protein